MRNYVPGQIIIPRHGVGGDGIVGIVQNEARGPWFVVSSLERHRPLAGPIARRDEAMREARLRMAEMRQSWKADEAK